MKSSGRILGAANQASLGQNPWGEKNLEFAQFGLILYCFEQHFGARRTYICLIFLCKLWMYMEMYNNNNKTSSINKYNNNNMYNNNSSNGTTTTTAVTKTHPLHATHARRAPKMELKTG